VQVGEYNGVVVRSRQQIVGADGEARGANLVRMRLERLDDTAASHVPQHARGVLVTGGQQPAGRLNAHRRKRAPYKNTRLYQHTDRLCSDVAARYQHCSDHVPQHITPVLRQLHWLRVVFKIAGLVHQSLVGTAPAYLADDCRLL